MINRKGYKRRQEGEGNQRGEEKKGRKKTTAFQTSAYMTARLSLGNAIEAVRKDGCDKPNPCPRVKK